MSCPSVAAAPSANLPGFRFRVRVRVFPRIARAELAVREIVKVGPLHELQAVLLRELHEGFFGNHPLLAICHRVGERERVL